MRHLEGAHDAAAVGGLHPGGGHRVERGQPGVEPLRAAGRIGLGLERRRHVREPTGDLEIVDHGPQVQPGAADEQGPVPPAGDARHGGAGRGLEPPQR